MAYPDEASHEVHNDLPGGSFSTEETVRIARSPDELATEEDHDTAATRVAKDIASTVANLHLGITFGVESDPTTEFFS